MLFDKTVSATTNSRERYVDLRNCEAFISHREIWQKSITRAAARKATAEGVNHIAIKEDPTGHAIFIYQVGGYTRERGLFCDCLDCNGRVVKEAGI